MKIKQVEELVGITRKNIRFYEEQELLSVGRSENGYREYGMEDVKRLKEIRLLRRLGVSLEEIRTLFDGRRSLEDVLERQVVQLEQQKDSLHRTQLFCRQMLEDRPSLEKLDADACLEQMDKLEKEGVILLETKIVYCDETGDDGLNTLSSRTFILTSLYMSSGKWQSNYNIVRDFRKQLKAEYGFHTSQEMHTKHFLTDKNPYRSYSWTNEQKKEILKAYTLMISSLDISVINVIIDKTKINVENYNVLEKALTYNIQRIENDSSGDWNFIIVTDKGRIAPMRKTARAIRAYNPIQSQFGGYINQPIKNMVEDILDKDSKESHFIQICDFISYFVHLYYIVKYEKGELPNRVGKLIDSEFVTRVIATFEANNILNLKASSVRHGLVIYPKT